MKRGCKNYLFGDYHWKSGIPIWNLDLMTRKKSSFFQNPADHKAVLTLSPTTIQSEITLKGNDYWLK
jgi:hypothetical protein